MLTVAPWPLAIGALGIGTQAGLAQAHPAQCLWSAPTEGVNFPDRGARYRFAEFRVPTGATLRLRGRFAQARYQSVASYDDQGMPLDTVRDYELSPARGDRNPFVRDGRRHGRGAWLLRLTDTRSLGRRHTLYAPAGADGLVRLIQRVYLPQRGTDADGGAGAPRPRLRLANGRLLSGAPACAALRPVASANIPSRAIGPASYRSILAAARVSVPTYPAFRPPRWDAFYNVGFAICQLAHDFRGCGRDPQRTGSLYSDQDVGYVATAIDRRLGRFLALQGRLPVTPGSRRARHGHPVQLRYWSLCAGESFATVATDDCVADDAVRTDRSGRYRIVVSRPRDRPPGLGTQCGLTYLAWPPNGDGAGTRTAGGLIIRNLLPSSHFRHSVQRTQHPGDERSVMGDYLPKGTYLSSTRALRRLCRAVGKRGSGD